MGFGGREIGGFLDVFYRHTGAPRDFLPYTKSQLLRRLRLPIPAPIRFPVALRLNPAPHETLLPDGGLDLRPRLGRGGFSSFAQGDGAAANHEHRLAGDPAERARRASLRPAFRGPGVAGLLRVPVLRAAAGGRGEA